MHAMDLHKNYVCGMCHVPSRAGKTRKAAAELLVQQPASLSQPVRALTRVTASAGSGKRGRSRQTA
jgi:flagellar transcriptional activator FlhC